MMKRIKASRPEFAVLRISPAAVLKYRAGLIVAENFGIFSCCCCCCKVNDDIF